MKVSIVIVTKDRPADIVNCLESIELQSRNCHQVIIVDASADQRTHSSTQAIVQRHASRLPLLYTHSQPGITLQRNIARLLIATDTDVVVYIDDDVMLESNTIALLQEFFSNTSDAVGVTGDINGEQAHSFFKKTTGRATLLYTPIVFGITSGIFTIINQATRVQTVQWLPGAFMAYRCSVVRDLAFDEWFTLYGLGEDLDFSLRASQRGRLYVQPSIQVNHHHSSVGRDWKQFGRMRILNRRYIQQKHFHSLRYRLGYWWATLWLCVFNFVRGIVSKRHRQEFLGNLQGVKVVFFG